MKDSKNLHIFTTIFNYSFEEQNCKRRFAVFGQNRDGEITKSIIILLHDSTVFFLLFAQNCKRRFAVFGQNRERMKLQKVS